MSHDGCSYFAECQHKRQGGPAPVLQPSPGAGSCSDVFMMDRRVDVHIGKWTQDAASVITFDQAQCGQHLHIFMHPLDVAAGSPGQFTHRNRALPLQGGYQCPAAFGQSAEKRAGAFEVQRLALVSVGPNGLARLPQGCTPVGRPGDGEPASCRRGVLLAASPAAMISSTKASTVVKLYGNSRPCRWQWSPLPRSLSNPITRTPSTA
jgi:hypothetical protein